MNQNKARSWNSKHRQTHFSSMNENIANGPIVYVGLHTYIHTYIRCSHSVADGCAAHTIGGWRIRLMPVPIQGITLQLHYEDIVSDSLHDTFIIFLSQPVGSIDG